MDKFAQHIDKLIHKVLNEAAEEKATEVSEKLHGGQKKIDKNKNGKIDSEDFKLLRKKKDMKEEPNEGAAYMIGSDGKPRNRKPNEKLSAFSLEDFGDDFDEDELEVDFDEFDPRDKSWEEIKAHTGSPDYSEIDEQEMEDPKDGELDEWFYFHSKDEDGSTPGDYEGDEDEEEEAEELSAQEPTYVGKGLRDNKPGKMFGSFSDEHGWYDESDRQHKGEFDFDYDEEEFEDFPSMYDKIGKNQKWFAPGEEGQRFFDTYKEKFGSPFKVRTRRDMGEQETEEGNAFTGALAKAKEDGESSFNVDGKKYSVKEAEEKWIQKTNMKKGALHKKLGIPEGDKIPKSKLNSLKKELMAKAKGDKKLSAADSTLLKQVNMALTLGKVNESKSNSVILTEDELIDMIERIVNEQEKENKVKGNIKVEKAKGTVETDRVLKADKDENDDYLKLVTKKMKDYLKDGSKGEYNANPEFFPKGNGQLAKMAKKAYEPTADVEEYIEDFAYGGGMENLDYDEIKPNEEWMEKTIEGSSKTGNSQDYANAEKTEFGKKLNAKRKRNAFSQEKKQSYQKSNQPTTKGEVSKVEKKSDKMFAKLESTEDKKTKLVNEQMEKMKNLISYSRKTQ
jgi:hypothetical protein